MARSRRAFYYKNNKFTIPTFVARIDKSKAPKRATFIEEQTVANLTSPYFVVQNKCSKQQVPFISTLLKHEADNYGYKLDNSVVMNNNNNKDSHNLTERQETPILDTNQNHKRRISKLLLFAPPSASVTKTTTCKTNDNTRPTPPAASGLINRENKQHKQTNCGQRNRQPGRTTSQSSSLKEELDKNVLKTTRRAMIYACKQYPSLSSRHVLNKYAHLFGLDSMGDTLDSTNADNTSLR